MSLPKWSDIFPAVTAKFKGSKDLVHAKIVKHFAFLIDAGSYGLVSYGSLGAARTLSFKEKLKVSGLADEALALYRRFMFLLHLDVSSNIDRDSNTKCMWQLS
jgi:dihydrodipicolinate synthase/N-acetylneuraminate lyase